MDIWEIIKGIFSTRDQDSVVCIDYENEETADTRSYSYFI
jgi:hypothetical protein